MTRRQAAAVAAAALALVVSYVAGAAWLLHFRLDRLVFAGTPAPPDAAALTGSATRPTSAISLGDTDGGAMLVRRFGAGTVGCVIDFPSQDGRLDRDARDLFPDIERAGLVVYAVAYPGRDGAPGRATIATLRSLARQAVAAVIATCGRTRTVVAGHALGALIAADAAGDARPAGLVLESASPTLGTAVRAHLRDHGYLRPLVALPVERLVAQDFSLADAVPPELHAVIFQGSADTRAPIAELWPDDSAPAHPPIVTVPGATHADTALRAKPAMIATMLGMIRGSQDEAAAGDEQD